PVAAAPRAGRAVRSAAARSARLRRPTRPRARSGGSPAPAGASVGSPAPADASVGSSAGAPADADLAELHGSAYSRQPPRLGLPAACVRAVDEAAAGPRSRT